MQGFSTGAFRYYSHTGNYMRKKVESMSVKKPVVPAAAEAPAAEAKPARKTAKSAVKTEKAPKTEKTAHKGRPPLSPEIYVEFAGKQYNITDLVDRAKADYRLTHKVGSPARSTSSLRKRPPTMSSTRSAASCLCKGCVSVFHRTEKDQSCSAKWQFSSGLLFYNVTNPYALP